MSSRPALLLPGLLCACGPQLVAPDEPAAEAGRKITQQVVVGFEHGEALFTVTRLEHFEDDTAAFVEPIDLPSQAVASDLEVLTAAGWQKAAFLDAAVASDSWGELTSPGDEPAQLLALLDQDLFGQVSLHAFGMSPGSTLGVRYRLRAPATYGDGQWSIVYPKSDGAPATFELPMGARSEPALEPEGDAVTGTRLVMPAGPIADADARWAVAALGPDRALWRLELDVAKALGTVPTRPAVVFAIDASHTEGAAGIAAQLELLPGYLAHVPDAQVEVVLYRRRAEPLFGRFVSVSEVSRLLQSLPMERLAPGNGSNLDQACALAADLLATQPGPARLVLLTDGELREALTTQVALAALGRLRADAVVHLVHREADHLTELTELRDDEEPLAELAAAHGGIALRVGGHTDDPALLARTLLGLVRPIRIDGLQVDAADLELEVPESLAEGQTLRQTAFAPTPPSTVTVRGKIWARDFARTIGSDAQLRSRLPAIALGTAEVRADLTQQEERSAAMAIGAVSRQTSYLWAPADAAASVAGTVEGLGLSGCSCGGSYGFSSHCGIGWGAARQRPDHLALLRALLAPAVAACARLGDGEPSQLTLETTRDEVVDVDVHASSAELASCLTEAAWQIRLGTQFTGHDHFSLTL